MNGDAEHNLQRELDGFIRLVGNRVLDTRQKQRMSRRVLSEISGVSQRTIVLLETGEGNISIALLYKVSNALKVHIDTLIRNNDPARQSALSIAEQFQAVSTEKQQQILALLGATRAPDKACRVCLIGLRGAGKSTLGRLLSDKLRLPFKELNRDIETLCGMSVQELMSLYGQEGYRKLERQAIENLVDSQDSVILAAAGGVVSDTETYDYVLKHFHTVWLKASPEEHMSRVRAQGDERPMAGNPQALSELKSILTSREALYRSADAMVNTSGRTLEQSNADLVVAIKALVPASTII